MQTKKITKKPESENVLSMEGFFYLLNMNAHAIKYIENPSEKIQLAAVRGDGIAIQHIKNPSEKVQLAAVKESGTCRCKTKMGSNSFD